MMFGLRDVFDYLECAACGTLQISRIPDLSKYYRSDYYSFDGFAEPLVGLRTRLALRLIGRSRANGSGAIARYLERRRPWMAGDFPEFLRRLPCRMTLNSRVLDVGCGAGTLLLSLRRFGYERLTGADPFIKNEIRYASGVTIVKKPLANLEGEFDLIMLHHAFEHLPDPAESLRHIQRLLAKDGRCVIRIPLLGMAWEQYGVNWVQMDPPRHLFLFTERSFRMLAQAAGFTVESSYFDSTPFQFWGSELYAKNIAMSDPEWVSPDPESQAYAELLVRADRLNRDRCGDQICFYLKRSL